MQARIKARQRLYAPARISASSFASSAHPHSIAPKRDLLRADQRADMDECSPRSRLAFPWPTLSLAVLRLFSHRFDAESRIQCPPQARLAEPRERLMLYLLYRRRLSIGRLSARSLGLMAHRSARTSQLQDWLVAGTLLSLSLAYNSTIRAPTLIQPEQYFPRRDIQLPTYAGI